MKKLFKAALLSVLFALAPALYFPLHAQNNPVLEGIADVGVINFNGKYYLAGVATNGGYYISDDLIKWTGPVHVFSMDNDWTKGQPFGDNQIHAADIRYFNGKFHFYWSVNFWGKNSTVVHIGHAVSDNILGPYTEPDKKTWFDDRIDASLFMDTDSSFYFYSVKFTDGNTIWGQPMADPWTHKGNPKMMFNSLPDTWERVDNNVNEGPWVMKYRSKYYLMYNANHTANSYGNYALGVAVADNPLGFNSGNKYPYPVVMTNLTENPHEMRYFLSSSTAAFGNWKYTSTAPDDQWSSNSFADADWKSGNKGFGNEIIKGSTITRPQTVWDTDDIWVRKHFSLSPAPTGNLQLLVNHAGPTEVYIDGQAIYKNTQGNYATVNLEHEIIAKLKTGEHVISIHSKKGRRTANVDVDLIDPLNQPGDDILFNPGQPNILKGPNGFEWWLVYFGIKNGGRRGQFVNRVLFNDRELTVDGPTGGKTTGYHPDPSAPIFGDTFDHTDNNALANQWDIKSGKWQVQHEELVQTDASKSSVALIKSHKACNYLFKVGIKSNSQTKSNVGVVAYYANAMNNLEVGFNQAEGTWYYKLTKDGKTSIKKNKLAAVFNFNVYHSLSVLKNDKRFEVLIDDNPAPGSNQIYSSFTEQGIPGLFTQNTSAAFDGLIYTPGWDEFDATITGWGNSKVGEKVSGNWKTSESGLAASGASFSVFKGDMLPQYEFATQVYNLNTGKGVAGIYPVYINPNNYLQAGIDFANGNLEIAGKADGKAIQNISIPLKRYQVNYADKKYTDGLNHYYDLKKNTELSALEIKKSIYDRHSFETNYFDSLKIVYHHDGQWYPLKFKTTSADAGVSKIEFDKITADAFRLMSATQDNAPPIYKVYVTEEKTSDYNLRAVKLKDRVILFLDGKQVADIKAIWPAAQVGLFGHDASVNYNGITLFEKP